MNKNENRSNCKVYCKQQVLFFFRFSLPSLGTETSQSNNPTLLQRDVLQSCQPEVIRPQKESVGGGNVGAIKTSSEDPKLKSCNNLTCILREVQPQIPKVAHAPTFLKPK